MECKFCGAIEAAPDFETHNRHGMCLTCARQYSDRSYESPTDFALMKLSGMIKGNVKGRKITRCECVTTSYQGPSSVSFGYQCGAQSVTVIDGRNVCASHANRDERVFVGIDLKKVVCKYDKVISAMRELMRVDPDFARTVVNECRQMVHER